MSIYSGKLYYYLTNQPNKMKKETATRLLDKLIDHLEVTDGEIESIKVKIGDKFFELQVEGGERSYSEVLLYVDQMSRVPKKGVRSRLNLRYFVNIEIEGLRLSAIAVYNYWDNCFELENFFD